MSKDTAKKDQAKDSSKKEIDVNKLDKVSGGTPGHKPTMPSTPPV